MTPYKKILNSFHSKFMSKVILVPELEKQFFYTALGDYETDLHPLSYDNESESIGEALTQSEINLLGSLMYRAYINRERDRILKLNNIVGKDIELTGMAHSKSQFNKAYEMISREIDETINKLKINSFYE